MTDTVVFGPNPWLGMQIRNCGRHISQGVVAWCTECKQWCSPGEMCNGCRWEVRK